MTTRVTRIVWGSAVLLGVAAGCDSGPHGGGITNGPMPSTSEEKPAMRTDLPAPTAPKQGEVLGEMGDDSTNAGIGGRGPDGASVKTPPAAGADAAKSKAANDAEGPKGR